MTRHQLLKNQRERILALCREYGVVSIKLFGSAARGDEDHDSDVDFLVELEPGRSLLDLGGLQMELEALLNCKVDVVTPNGLRQRLRKHVLKEAVAI